MRIVNTDSLGASEIKILVYGESGAGKTTLATTIDEPVLVVSVEAGLLSIKAKKLDYIDVTRDDAGNLLPVAKRFDRITEVYKYVQTEEVKAKYKWLFIDSLTEISQNLIERLQLEFPDKSDTLKMYGENSKKIRQFVKAFRDLPHYNVVFTALAETDKDQDNRRFQKIKMIGNISAELPAMFDEVFYLFVDKDGARQLVTSKSEGVQSKDRSGKLEKFESADLSVIIKKIRGVSAEKQKEKK